MAENTFLCKVRSLVGVGVEDTNIGNIFTNQEHGDEDAKSRRSAI